MPFSIIHWLTLLVVQNPFFVSFLSGVLSEELLIFVAALAGRGLLQIWIVFLFGIFGILTIDTIWFVLGKSRLIRYLKDHKMFSDKGETMGKIHHLAKKHQIVSLFVTKFIYGTRVITIIYHSAKEMPYRKFIFYDSLSVIIWALIMVTIGWLAGRGFTQILGVARGIERILAIILVVVVVLYVTHKLATKYLLSSS